MPRNSSKTDWEVEPGVVIGRHARYVTDHAEAMACVTGYIVANDVSVPDPQQLRMQLWVNGEWRQHGDTKNMIVGRQRQVVGQA